MTGRILLRKKGSAFQVWWKALVYSLGSPKLLPRPVSLKAQCTEGSSALGVGGGGANEGWGAGAHGPVGGLRDTTGGAECKVFDCGG